MHAGYVHSLVAAPDIFSPSEDGLVNISRAINPRFRGVSADDAPGHRSQLSLRQRKELMERGGGGHNVVAKRNARERTRVHTVNKAFSILKQRLPALRIHSKRVSKLRILKAAIVYINNLMDTLGTTGKFSLPSRESSRRNGGSDFHHAIDTAPAAPPPVAAAAPLKNPSLDTLPYFKSFIDYAPYIPQSTTVGATSGATMGSAAGTMPAVSSSIEFASILSTAAASIGNIGAIGYSNPWGAYA